MHRLMKNLVPVFIFILFALPVFSADLSLEQIIQNMQSNQSKIKDMYAETTTTMTSNIAMPGTESKGPQKMVQKGKIWTKGKDKSKIEMISPTRQITITNGDQMAIINPDTGQKLVQDMKKIREKYGMPDSSKQMDMEKALEYFDMSVKRSAAGGYVITGVPREMNKFLGKMEFYVDSGRWLPIKIMMYDSKGKVISQSGIEYEEFSGVWAPVKNVSDVNSPMGKMNIEMTYENIKMNQGIKDSEFKI